MHAQPYAGPERGAPSLGLRCALCGRLGAHGVGIAEMHALALTLAPGLVAACACGAQAACLTSHACNTPDSCFVLAARPALEYMEWV